MEGGKERKPPVTAVKSDFGERYAAVVTHKSQEGGAVLPRRGI
jgi:hypothetical protein